MVSYANKVYGSTILILRSASRSFTDGGESSGYSAITMDLSSSDEKQEQPLIIKTALSSVPAMVGPDLWQDYRDLGGVLAELTELGEDDEWGVATPVFITACYVAAELMANDLPAPRIFNHGARSVVFNWTGEHTNLYLTVSADKVSALISSPERIQRRIEYTPNQIVSSSFALLNSAGVSRGDRPFRQLTAGTLSEQSEVLI